MYIRQEFKLPAATGMGGLLLGASLGLGISYLRLRKLNKEYQVLNDNYRDMQSKIVKLSDLLKERTAAVEAFSRQLDDMAAQELEATKDVEFVELPEIAEVVSIFPTEDTPVWDQEKENKERERFQGRPYVISVEEFQENETDFPQRTYTFYEGDQVLIDEHDVPVYNHANVVGELRFGHGSGDPNIVYIRNVRGKTEYEILRDHGHYAVEVLGNEIEAREENADLKHSSVLRMRRDT